MIVSTRSSSRTPTQRNESTPAAERTVRTVPIQEELTDFVETITDQLDDSWDSVHLLSTNDRHTPERAEWSTIPLESNF
jgi:hypothetical protein